MGFGNFYSINFYCKINYGISFLYYIIKDLFQVVSTFSTRKLSILSTNFTIIYPNNSQLGHYLAGLIESDGSITVPKNCARERVEKQYILVLPLLLQLMIYL